MSDRKVILTIFLAIFCYECQANQPHCTVEMTMQTFAYEDDPTLFYICRESEKPWIIKCPSNSGFISTTTLHGCVPWPYWPHAPKDEIPSCALGQHTKLYRNVNPQYFYACKAVDTPIIVKCPKGQGFSFTKSLVGCVPWAQWKWEDQIIDA